MDQIMLLAIQALALCACLQSATATVGGNAKHRSDYHMNRCTDDSSEPDMVNVKCLAESICLDVVNRCAFVCMKYSIECCKDSKGNITLNEAPRGKMCCSGVGMYRPQTHSCFEGKLVENESTKNCPNSLITQYNTDYEICCQAPFPRHEPNVYLQQDDYMCCGGKYIHGYREGCCANKPFNMKTHYCKGAVVEPNSSYRRPSSIRCDDSQHMRDCSQETMYRQMQSLNATAGFHVTVLKVGNFRENRRRNEVRYEITSAKQLIERNTKLHTISNRNLRSISFPACNCFGTLRSDESYILLSKTKFRKNTKIRQNKYFLLTLWSSDVFSLLFGVST